MPPLMPNTHLVCHRKKKVHPKVQSHSLTQSLILGVSPKLGAILSSPPPSFRQFFMGTRLHFPEEGGGAPAPHRKETGHYPLVLENLIFSLGFTSIWGGG